MILYMFLYTAAPSTSVSAFPVTAFHWKMTDEAGQDSRDPYGANPDQLDEEDTTDHMDAEVSDRSLVRGDPFHSEDNRCGWPGQENPGSLHGSKAQGGVYRLNRLWM